MTRSSRALECTGRLVACDEMRDVQDARAG
jgi:hypothetical protein